MFSVFSVEELSVLVESVVALVWLCVSSSTDEVFVSKATTQVATIAQTKIKETTVTMIFLFFIQFSPFLFGFIIACYRNRHGEVSKGSATPLYGEGNRVGRRKTKAVSRKCGNRRTTHFTVSVGVRYARCIGIEAEFRVGVLFELVKVNDSVQVLALLDVGDMVSDPNPSVVDSKIEYGTKEVENNAE